MYGGGEISLQAQVVTNLMTATFMSILAQDAKNTKEALTMHVDELLEINKALDKFALVTHKALGF
jgi:hypothetical protein